METGINWAPILASLSNLANRRPSIIGAGRSDQKSKRAAELVFIFHDERGEEKQIFQVKDFKVLPFEREE